MARKAKNFPGAYILEPYEVPQQVPEKPPGGGKTNGRKYQPPWQRTDAGDIAVGFEEGTHTWTCPYIHHTAYIETGFEDGLYHEEGARLEDGQILPSDLKTVSGTT